MTRFHESLDTDPEHASRAQGRDLAGPESSGERRVRRRNRGAVPQDGDAGFGPQPAVRRVRMVPREVREFVQAAEHSGVPSIDNKSRVIKVIKRRWIARVAAAIMKQVLDYRSSPSAASARRSSWIPPTVRSACRVPPQKVAKLAWNIAQLRQETRRWRQRRSCRPPSAMAPAVYLASAAGIIGRLGKPSKRTPDARVSGRPDASCRGTRRPPDAAVARRLRAGGALGPPGGHLYGAVPDGPSQKSVVVVRNELAMRKNVGGGSRRVIWIPKGSPSTSAEQEGFFGASTRAPRRNLAPI